MVALWYDDGHGGTALGPLVWSAGSLPKTRRIFWAVRDHAMLPDPDHFWERGAGWIGNLLTVGNAADASIWLDSVGLLFKRIAFQGTLHWHAVAGDLGVSGASYVESLILLELWAGEWLVLEKNYLQVW